MQCVSVSFGLVFISRYVPNKGNLTDCTRRNYDSRTKFSFWRNFHAKLRHWNEDLSSQIDWYDAKGCRKNMKPMFKAVLVVDLSQNPQEQGAQNDQ